MKNSFEPKRHAYLIMAHDNYNQLIQLVEELDDARNAIFIHIDKKSKLFTNEVQRKLLSSAEKSEIEIYQNLKVYWSDFSLVECELFLLKAATRRGHFSYYHLISGQDFPIKDQDYIHSFFDENFGKEFIDYQAFFTENHINLILNRVKYYHPFRKYCRGGYHVVNFFFRALDRVCILIQKIVQIDRCKKFNLDVCYGSNWFSITDEFARYVLNQEKNIYKYFRWTNCPDELFIQTILKNSSFIENLYRETTYDFYGNLRLLDFHRGNPYTYRKQDFDEIKNSPYLFVRKVDEKIDEEILQLIKKMICKQ